MQEKSSLIIQTRYFQTDIKSFAMSSCRLNLSYKVLLIGICMLAALWSSQCEGDTSADAQVTHQLHSAPKVTLNP